MGVHVLSLGVWTGFLGLAAGIGSLVNMLGLFIMSCVVNAKSNNHKLCISCFKF